MSVVDVDIRDEIGVTLDARIHRREIQPHAASRWDSTLDSLDGQEVRVTFTRWKKRTTHQNALLWSVYREILGKLRAKYLDLQQACPIRDEDELHAIFKGAYIAGRTLEVLGRMEYEPGSSTKLSTAEFSRYVERIVAHAAEWGIYVSLPGDLIESWNE